MDKLRILLADDHKVMRRGLRLLVGGQADMDVVGEANNGREAITLAQQLQSDDASIYQLYPFTGS